MIEHIPVLVNEVCDILSHSSHLERVVDATLGLGGYAEAFLTRWENLRILGIDRDKQALEEARKRLSAFESRILFRQGNFRYLDQILEQEGWQGPDAVVFDLGVSNLQLSIPERGFSFDIDGPLDMRMGNGTNGFPSSATAEELINTWPVEDLARIFKTYGEERFSLKIARGIVKHRKKNGPITGTQELVSVIRRTIPAPVQRKMGRNPARKVFQALRIAVNDELQALEEAIASCRKTATPGMVTAFVSYHSLEDRIVKHSLRDWYAAGLGSFIHRGGIKPSEEEIAVNKKARSARLRAFLFTTPQNAR
ncbi:MAG: 16S rRNA (cytosine(1402)-N(4))-methyltransferase RsmH [Thermovirgaceae bacterium]